jgi:ATP-dependent RNA helicase DeaD
LPEIDARPAPRRSARRRTKPVTDGRQAVTANNDHPAQPDDSPLLAAVLAAQKTYRFGGMELPPTIARAIEKMGFTEPTEVQARAIGPLREGKDLIGQAQTGTGKTAAFGIPIVEKVDPSARHVQALVLTPTRELCVQVTEEIRRIGIFRNVGAVAIYGGSSMDRQISALKKGTPVVVGTPGRVLSLIGRGELRLDRVGTVILTRRTACSIWDSCRT